MLAATLAVICTSCMHGRSYSSTPSTGAGGTETITLNSNKNCAYYVDGDHVANGRRVQVSVTDAPHQIVCKPRGYIAKEEYINPPYDPTVVYGFTFMYGEEEGTDEPEPARQPTATPTEPAATARAVQSIYQDLGPMAAAVAAQIARVVGGTKRAAVTGFINEASGKRVQLSADIEQAMTSGLVAQRVQMVKRDRLSVLVREMRNQTSAMFDRSSAVRIGKLAGAQVIVTGSFRDTPQGGKVKVHVEAADVETGAILYAVDTALLRSAAIVNAVKGRK